MEKNTVPMNQYPQSPDVTGQQHQQQPPVYQDPNAMQQNQAYQQPGQMGYQSPPPQHAGSPYGQPGQPQYTQQMPMQQQHLHQGHPQAPGMPHQQSGTVYQNATPIASLNRSPAPADCPACGQRAMTNVSYEIGNTTHAWALGLCCLVCLGCIPYVMNSLKDVQHKCGRCGVLLATWHRSGTTEVHIHS